MRALVLTCSTGGGHNTAAMAIKEELKSRGHQVTVLDFMDLRNRRTAKIVGGLYVEIVKYCPKLFGLLYKVGGMISSPNHKSPVYFANTFMAKYLIQYLKENPVDIIITPHLYPAETLTYLKKRGEVNLPVIAVATDYTCIPFWEEIECEAYVIAHPSLTMEYLKRGLPKEKLYPYGIPVRKEFRTGLTANLDEREAKLQQKKSVTFLVLGGSMGFGKLPVLTKALEEACTKKEHIIVVCGNNNRLRRLLKRRHRASKNVFIYGYVSKISRLMKKADVIFTKPGGLSTTEIASLNCLFILTQPIPGCETENKNFFVSHGMTCDASTVEEQIRLGLKMIQTKKLRDKLLLAQRSFARVDASEKIAELAERLVREE